MNYAELQAAILDDTHRPDYAGAVVQRCIAEGEERIFDKLEAYDLSIVLNDAARVAANGPEYNIAGTLANIRQVFRADGKPLDRVDETTIYMYNTLSTCEVYVPRVSTIAIAGTPGVGATFRVDYFGLPSPLSVVNTNTLLDKHGLLYKNAAAVSVYQRAQNYDAAQVCLTEMQGLINEINRRIKKLIGGRRSSNPYNVSFRSSY